MNRRARKNLSLAKAQSQKKEGEMVCCGHIALEKEEENSIKPLVYRPFRWWSSVL